ncbi:MAG: alpha/beta hydrolase [Candidatus Marsarchaeota archaeon]|nr:alpha/beta hydrolase [Candidatus Marsarchaeota archaeon]MCL5412904.1 alpha/beta hydrolase [Candidatus Marsarchaeota archaeon]
MTQITNAVDLVHEGNDDSGSIGNAEMILGMLKNTLVRRPQLYKELRVAKEVIELLKSKVYAGCDVLHGNGEPVVLVPGFSATDSMMALLYLWLNSVGYKAYYSGLGQNKYPPEETLTVLGRTLERATDRQGKPATLIGWSLGGGQSKVLSDRYPEKVERVVGLAPVFNSDLSATPMIIPVAIPIALFNLIKYNTGVVSEWRRFFMQQLDEPVKVPHFSIYSESDGVLAAKSCIRGDAENIRVNGTHMGMQSNREVFENLAWILRDKKPTKLAVVKA